MEGSLIKTSIRMISNLPKMKGRCLKYTIDPFQISGVLINKCERS